MVHAVELRTPYLLFLGAAESALSAKTAAGIAHWRPENCLGQMRLAGCAADLGLPDMDVAEAAARGAGTFIPGIAPLGGRMPEEWNAILVAALEAGMDIASGLHTRIAAIPEVAAAAARAGGRILDLREPPAGLPCGTGAPRPGRRVLTVGTDCAVGKMFTALALEREMNRRGHASDFRATGQTGILIAGAGLAVDAVVADFISGAVEVLAPAAEPGHWDVIEGQGSLFHPAYAGVSLGLLHGAQAEALILCHELGRSEIDVGGDYPAHPIAPLEEVIAMNERAARLTEPRARVVGMAVNSAALGPDAAAAEMADLGRRLGMPVVDPVRTGVGPLADALEALPRP
jgi:uncharacterized NAD-dependent epimerase/dehydratase family protein